MTDHPLKILEWLAEMGDDVPLADHPVDRFAEAAQPQPRERSQIASPGGPGGKGSLEERIAAIKQSNFRRPPERVAAVLPDETVVAAARETAKAAPDLESLKTALEQFHGCNLRMNAKTTVFASGNPASKLMIVDEHPSRDEDSAGSPFAGRSGALLEKMLAAIGLGMDQVYLAAAIPWHPPGNKSPTVPELEICRPFLERHIQLAAPRLVLCLGNTPARLLFNVEAQVLSLRGQMRQTDINGHSFEAIASLAPSFLLQYPAQKKLVWQDLLLVKAKLASL